jgi:hypothetical protein
MRAEKAHRLLGRTVGRPTRFINCPMTPSGVSPGLMTFADSPSAHAEAATNGDPPWPSCVAQPPCFNLSSMSLSCVAASGTRSSASASTISANPSRVDSPYSRRKSSTPPMPVPAFRINWM